MTQAALPMTSTHAAAVERRPPSSPSRSRRVRGPGGALPGLWPVASDSALPWGPGGAGRGQGGRPPAHILSAQASLPHQPRPPDHLPLLTHPGLGVHHPPPPAPPSPSKPPMGVPRITGCPQGGATLESALDWLCLNLPRSQLPQQFKSANRGGGAAGAVRVVSRALQGGAARGPAPAGSDEEDGGGAGSGTDEGEAGAAGAPGAANGAEEEEDDKPTQVGKGGCGCSAAGEERPMPHLCQPPSACVAHASAWGRGGGCLP